MLTQEISRLIQVLAEHGVDQNDNAVTLTLDIADCARFALKINIFALTAARLGSRF